MQRSALSELEFQVPKVITLSTLVTRNLCHLFALTTVLSLTTKNR